MCRNIVVAFAEQKILFLRPEQEKDKTHFTDKDVSSPCVSIRPDLSTHHHF